MSFLGSGMIASSRQQHYKDRHTNTRTDGHTNSTQASRDTGRKHTQRRTHTHERANGRTREQIERKRERERERETDLVSAVALGDALIRKDVNHVAHVQLRHRHLQRQRPTVLHRVVKDRRDLVTDAPVRGEWREKGSCVRVHLVRRLK